MIFPNRFAEFEEFVRALKENEHLDEQDEQLTNDLSKRSDECASKCPGNVSVPQCGELRMVCCKTVPACNCEAAKYNEITVSNNFQVLLMLNFRL